MTYDPDRQAVDAMEKLLTGAQHRNGSDPDPSLEDDPPRSGLLDGLRSGAWLQTQEFDPLRWALPGIIPEGSTLFVGPPKIGKSWFLLALCLALATEGGGWMLRSQLPRRPVLYLALEDGDRRLQSRCRRLLVEEPIPAGFHYLTRCQPGKVLDTVAEWLALNADECPVVVLDTLGKVMPPALVGESTYQRDYRVGTSLKRRVDDVAGSALVTAHHDRKAEAADFIEAVSGSNGLAGSADTIVLLKRPRHGTAGTLQVTGRDVPEGEYAVTYVAGCSWELAGDDLDAAAREAIRRRASEGLGDRSVDVVVTVGKHPEGVRAGDVAKALGIDVKQAGVYLGRMADTGRILRPVRGLYTPVGSVGSVGLDETDPPKPNTSNTTNTPTGDGDLFDERTPE